MAQEELNPAELFTFDNGNQMAMADIFGVNIDEVEEVRGVPVLPTAPYQLMIDADHIPQWKIIKYTDKETGQEVKQIKLMFQAKVVGVFDQSLLDWIGHTYTEFSFPVKSVKDVKDRIGNMKAVAIDSGIIKRGESMTADELFKRFAGACFVGVVNYRKDKNGYESNRLDLKSIKPSQAPEEAPFEPEAGNSDQQPAAV